MTYGHVIVDEAQDLTLLQLRAVQRRAKGLTFVGDDAQRSNPHGIGLRGDRRAAGRDPGRDGDRLPHVGRDRRLAQRPRAGGRDRRGRPPRHPAHRRGGPRGRRRRRRPSPRPATSSPDGGTTSPSSPPTTPGATRAWSTTGSWSTPGAWTPPSCTWRRRVPPTSSSSPAELGKRVAGARLVERGFCAAVARWTGSPRQSAGGLQ